MEPLPFFMDSIVHYLLTHDRPVVAVAGNKARLPLFTRRFAYLLGMWLAQEGVTLRVSPCRGFAAWLLKGWKSVTDQPPELYLAFRKQQGYTASVYASRASSEVAEALNPNFSRLSGVEKMLASTHVEAVLGRDHCTPADCLLYFVKDGATTHEDVDGNTGVWSYALLAASHCRDAGLPIALFQAGDHTLVKETLAWLRSHPNRAIAAKALALTEKLSPGPAGFTGASRWTT